jgi:uncharacterized membrane protein (DUF4010 family)
LVSWWDCSENTWQLNLAGLRTFALITVFGTLCGLLSLNFGGWVLASGFVALTGALLTGHVAELKGERAETGVTTEVAALTMFSIGAYLVIGYREAAIALGGGTAVLLHFKGQLHGIAARLGEDSKAIMQFALISMVVLPILPNRTYGPYQVLNPRQIWLMVVLIVGIGLGGYIAYKLLGASTSILLAGVLGGVISSTATSVTYARRSHKETGGEPSAASVILLASAASCALVLLEMAVVAPSFLRATLAPMAAFVGTIGAISAFCVARQHQEPSEMPAQSNPTELKSAIYFAALYALILVAIAAVKDAYGVRGLYAVALASGVAEVHALTLSTCQLVQTGRITIDQGWRVIMIALISNLGFKGAAILVVGSRTLWKKIVPGYLLTVAVGIALVTLSF